MTKGEFQKKVIELLRKYKPTGIVKKTIMPLFSIAENLSKEERGDIYKIVEETIITQKETEKLSEKLKDVYSELKKSISDISNRLESIKKRLDNLNQKNENIIKGFARFGDSGSSPDKGKGRNTVESRAKRIIQPTNLQINKTRRGNIMKYNQHSFPSEKPNFGLKLNKLFSAYITEYGPKYITMVISDSILYTNNLILRISLKTKEVLIGSSKMVKLYETEDNERFLITEKPEVIPYGNKKGFYFKYITYEDILNLTNGDFFKVFNQEILDFYKESEVKLSKKLKKVGYYSFE